VIHAPTASAQQGSDAERHPFTIANRYPYSNRGKPPMATKTKKPEVGTNGVLHTERFDPKAIEGVKISPLRQAVISIPIVGTAPLMILRFSQKAKDKIMTTQRAGTQAKSKKNREARDFEADYEAAKYVGGTDDDRWNGMNAASFRNAAISACRVAGFTMTRAKLSLFIEADGFDIFDATPLVRIEGKPQMHTGAVRNATGVVDIRARAMWREWKAVVRVRFDEDQFSPSDILNLMLRVGQQVGIGEGRPDGRDGNGMGMGLFAISMDDISLERLATTTPAVNKAK
jgi:hypothetical protein